MTCHEPFTVWAIGAVPLTGLLLAFGTVSAVPLLWLTWLIGCFCWANVVRLIAYMHYYFELFPLPLGEGNDGE